MCVREFEGLVVIVDDDCVCLAKCNQDLST
jgi:hypothetical protein